MRALIEYVDKLLAQGLPIIFDFEHLSRLAGVRDGKLAAMIYSTNKFYKRFHIQKRSGGIREIDAPTVILKGCQRWILRNILDKVPVSEVAHGFRHSRSILSNAALHTKKVMVLNIDIQDFFPSIQWADVFNIFRELGYGKKVSFYLARLTTLDNRLPQGAPTSPGLSNIAVRHLDLRLSRLGKSLGITYSRYADDMTFSGEGNLPSVIPLLRRMLKEEGFRINEAKTRVMRDHRRQEVTGLVVNQTPNVRRGRIRWLRQQIYYLRKFGPDSCMERLEIKHRNFREYLYGHALLVNMVNPQKGGHLLEGLDSISW